ncbi:hypothetical protein F5141DRAFT_1069075 [Pisolithus sp. B1]|nr:hypothetical protein F5141DRAFT_1069075 [Pisolithus sp. B1]
MAPWKLPANSLLKVGPPVGVRKLKKIKAANLQTVSGDTVAQCPTAKLCVQHSSEGLTNENCKEEYLNSFQSKAVTLKNGRKMNQPMALQQLHAGVITMEDIADEGGHDQYSEHDEQAMEDAVQDTHAAKTHIPNTRDHPPATVPHTVTHILVVMHLSDEGIGMDGQDVDDQGAPDTDTVDDSDNGHGGHGDVQHGDSEGKFHCVDNYLRLTYISAEGSDSDWSADDRCCHKVEQHHKEILAGNYDINRHPTTPPCQTSSSSSSSSSSSDGDNCTMEVHSQTEDQQPQVHKPGQLPMEAIRKAQALGACTTQDAQGITDEYGKSLRSIMIAAGLTTKATQTELIWNMHQAWYAGKHSKQSGETTKHYHACQMQHYEEHKDEHDYLQLWVEICFQSNQLLLKAQTWCNMEGIQVFGCVIYSGNDEAACQAQGIFSGSQLYMQLASERQTDVARLMDYLATIIKYKTLDSAAEVPLPNFALTLHVSYYSSLALRLQESRQDHNHHILPLVLLHKLYKVGIIYGQKNVPWQTLLDLLYLHQFTLVDWPAGVSAVGANFNVKCLNADKLCALIVPFLKEQMGADYMLEAPGDDDEDVVDEGLVPVPESSFYLMDWTPGISVSMQHNILELTNQPEQLELFRDADLKMFDVPLVINTYDQSLHLLSDSQVFLKGLPKGMNWPPIDGASTSVASPLPSSLPLPPSLSLPPASPPLLSSPPTRPSPSPPRSCIPWSLNNCKYPESPGNIKQNLRKKHLCHREEHITVTDKSSVVEYVDQGCPHKRWHEYNSDSAWDWSGWY